MSVTDARCNHEVCCKQCRQFSSVRLFFLKKSKSSLCTRHQSEWRNGGVAPFIKRSVSRPDRFGCQGTEHYTNWIARSVLSTAGLETAGKKHLPLPGFVSRLYGCTTHSRCISRSALPLASAKRRIHSHGAECIRGITKAYKFSRWEFQIDET